MAKTGQQYGDELRELRAAGFDFPASRGYLLASPAQWSTGLKSAVTRAFNRLETEAEAEQESVDQFGPDAVFEDEDDTEISDFGIEFFEDSAGDEFEEWDDIDFFDFDEGEEFLDEESDQYTEVSG